MNIEWVYQINKEDEYMMRCKHEWVDAELDYHPERWDRDLEDYVYTLAFSHCKICGAQRSKEVTGKPHYLKQHQIKEMIK